MYEIFEQLKVYVKSAFYLLICALCPLHNRYLLIVIHFLFSVSFILKIPYATFTCSTFLGLHIVAKGH